MLNALKKTKNINTQAKRNFATLSDFTVEIKDLEQIKGPERYLKLDQIHDCHLKYYMKYAWVYEILRHMSVKWLFEKVEMKQELSDTREFDLSIMAF